MPDTLFYNTTTPALRKILVHLMSVTEFSKFRLVGGTSLSLQLGHRKSVDIDLFTDAPYASVDFDSIDRFLRENYPYVDTHPSPIIGMGKSYFVGDNESESIKLDIFYTDPFIRSIKEVDGIRLASVEEIIAMKVDVISRGARKKDFWDIHEVMEDFPLDEILALHKERHPYVHDRSQVIASFTGFGEADEDFDPICLRQKHWELIKLDIQEMLRGY